MKPIRILILGVGGNVSQGILKAIHFSGLDCYIVGACVIPDAAGLYLCDKSYISPYAVSNQFLPWLYDICVHEQINMIFSGVEEVIERISPICGYLKERTGSVFRASAPEQLKIGQDKYCTSQWLEGNGFRAPGCCRSDDSLGAEELLEQYGFPLIAKPRCGKSSSGVFQIWDREELLHTLQMEDYVIQECVGEAAQEYTVGCYRGLDGYIPEPIIMRRDLKDGASWRVEVVENTAILGEAIRICEIFRPNGPLNIQLRLDKHGHPVPFEFNVRFSGTTPMRAHFGFQDVKAMLLETLYQQDIHDCFAIQHGRAYRYTNELYVMERKGVYTDMIGNQ